MTPTEHICAAYEDKIYCFATIGDKNKDMVYSDPTGNFPVRLHNGMLYVAVVYVYKCNAILLLPMKSREGVSMMEVFTSIYADLEAIMHTPNIHIKGG